MRSHSTSLAAGIALLGMVGVATVLSHPDPEALALAETPAPAGKPLISSPLSTGLVQPLDTAIADGSVMHPAPDCPAPDRGYNALFASAAHRHAPATVNGTGCGIHSIAERESNQNPMAVSIANAIGMMQFTPPTAGDLGIDPRVPAEAVDGAARYLAWLADRFPHVSAEELPYFILAAWNWGLGNVRRTGCSTWACLERKLPRETRVFVAGVMQMMRDGTWYREGVG